MLERFSSIANEDTICNFFPLIVALLFKVPGLINHPRITKPIHPMPSWKNPDLI